ncbi:MAG TPA: GntR family transcriptional regulator [Acidimicrobiia bacterium]|nr:GntR family transcriptional regulator [Acidimicrobiia bacterium]
MIADASSPGLTLSARVAADLRLRIDAGEWAPGERLPGEHDLAAHYAVSRATVRTALQDLESRGLTVTRHGLGTILTAHTQAGQADLRRLESMTDTIARHGRVPGMQYRSIVLRPATPEETAKLALTEGEEVLATERALTADGAIVAFSYDAVPRAVLPPDFDPSEVAGSLFALLERYGERAVVAVTELHAAHGDHIGWGERPPNVSYLLLVQVHADPRGVPVAYANTYFIEGRFPFALVRHR